jgi:hypothetical protein
MARQTAKAPFVVGKNGNRHETRAGFEIDIDIDIGIDIRRISKSKTMVTQRAVFIELFTICM